MDWSSLAGEIIVGGVGGMILTHRNYAKVVVRQIH